MHFDWQSFLDWFSLLSAVGTVLVAALAVWSIRQASKQAKANVQLVVDERRIDLQLGALQRLVDVIASANYTLEQQEQRRLQATVQLALIEASLPTCRARFGSKDPAAVREALGIPAGEGWSVFDSYPDEAGVGVSDRMVLEIAAAVRDLATRAGA